MSLLENVLLRDTRALQPLATAVVEGSLYYVTDEAVTEQSRGGAWVDWSDAGTPAAPAIDELTGDVTAGPGSGSQAATIANDAVTYAKMQNISAISKLLGRGSAAGAGNPEEITLGTNLSMSGTTLNAADTDTGVTELTGDVTAGPGNGSQAATIPNNTVIYAKMQDVSAASKLLGRGDSGSGDPQEITLGTGLTMTGTTLDAAGGGSGLDELTGDVTAGPGSGSQAATVKAAIKTRVIGITVDGAGTLLTTGAKGFRSFPVAGTIIGVRLIANAAGDLVFDVKKSTYAAFPTQASIVASAPPTLSAVQKSEDVTLTGWTTAVAAGDIFGFEITGTPLTITRATLELTIVVS